MVNYTDRIEEHKKRLRLIEQEFLIINGRIKELEALQKESEEKKEGK